MSKMCKPGLGSGLTRGRQRIGSARMRRRTGKRSWLRWSIWTARGLTIRSTGHQCAPHPAEAWRYPCAAPFAPIPSSGCARPVSTAQVPVAGGRPEPRRLCCRPGAWGRGLPCLDHSSFGDGWRVWPCRRAWCSTGYLSVLGCVSAIGAGRVCMSCWGAKMA